MATQRPRLRFGEHLSKLMCSSSAVDHDEGTGGGSNLYTGGISPIPNSTGTGFGYRASSPPEANTHGEFPRNGKILLDQAQAQIARPNPFCVVSRPSNSTNQGLEEQPWRSRKPVPSADRWAKEFSSPSGAARGRERFLSRLAATAILELGIGQQIQQLADLRRRYPLRLKRLAALPFSGRQERCMASSSQTE